MNPGIDYGHGKTNIDATNGIRYGVISQHSVLQAWADSAEADYGKPTCPKCGNEVQEFNDTNADGFEQYNPSCFEQYKPGFGCADWTCFECKHNLDSCDASNHEPIGWNYRYKGYELTDCLDSDIFVLKSPFYTLAPFCSPCVPGAGNLNDAGEGVKTYCLGHDWFDDQKAPYPIFSVANDEEIKPTP